MQTENKNRALYTLVGWQRGGGPGGRAFWVTGTIGADAVSVSEGLVSGRNVQGKDEK